MNFWLPLRPIYLLHMKGWNSRLISTSLRGHFKWGGWVYLRLQPCKLKSLAYKGKWKFSPRFYRPFQVLQRVEEVAYKLDLPFDSKIHPVFHVSYLKLKLDQYVSPIPTIPSLDETRQLMAELVAVLHTRTKKFRIRTNKWSFGTMDWDCTKGCHLGVIVVNANHISSPCRQDVLNGENYVKTLWTSYWGH